MSEQTNERETLVTDICMYLTTKGIDITDIKQELYIVVNNYEVQKTTTEIVPYEGDVNEKLIKRFIASKTVQGCTKRTLEFYSHELILFAQFINKSFTQVTADDVRYYTAVKMTVDKVSRTTAGNKWRVLSTFYAWMTKEEIVDKNIMLRVESIKKEKKKKKAFTEEDIEKIRDGCRNERDRCLIEVLLSTWCRVTEVQNMKISDIKPDGSMVVLGKGEKERTVYLNAKARHQIQKYMASRNDEEDWLFVTLDRPHNRLNASGIETDIRKIGRKMGVENCHPHRFRRTGATFALRAGMPIEYVSRILGHENIATTQIYLDIDDKGVQASHEKYSR